MACAYEQSFLVVFNVGPSGRERLVRTRKNADVSLAAEYLHYFAVAYLGVRAFVSLVRHVVVRQNDVPRVKIAHEVGKSFGGLHRTIAAAAARLVELAGHSADDRLFPAHKVFIHVVGAVILPRVIWRVDVNHVGVQRRRQQVTVVAEYPDVVVGMRFDKPEAQRLVGYLSFFDIGFEMPERVGHAVDVVNQRGEQYVVLLFGERVAPVFDVLPFVSYEFRSVVRKIFPAEVEREIVLVNLRRVRIVILVEYAEQFAPVPLPMPEERLVNNLVRIKQVVQYHIVVQRYCLFGHNARAGKQIAKRMRAGAFAPDGFHYPVRQLGLAAYVAAALQSYRLLFGCFFLGFRCRHGLCSCGHSPPRAVGSGRKRRMGKITKITRDVSFAVCNLFSRKAGFACRHALCHDLQPEAGIRSGAKC